MTLSLRHNRWVRVSDFDYYLPDELIARQPLPDRAAARLLHIDRAGDSLRDQTFGDNFPQCSVPMIYLFLTILVCFRHVYMGTAADRARNLCRL